MATPDWRGTAALSAQLRAAPQRFDVLQAVRLIEAAGGAVRFRGSHASAFPASDVEHLELAEDGAGASEITLTSLSLAGAFGPLPRPLGELVAARARRRDTAPRDFLDLFHHRLASLLVALRRRTRPAAEPVAPEATRLAGWLFAIQGLGTPALRKRGELAEIERGLPLVTGLLARRPLSLHAAERLVAHHFGLPVRIAPLQGRWLALDDEQTTILGAAGRNRELGDGAVLGRRVWDQAAALRIVIGPLDHARLIAFLPGGRAHRELGLLLRFALDRRFDLELVLEPSAGTVPAPRLDRGARRLGWTSRLGPAAGRRPAAVRLTLTAQP
jgi:type VI secretion system protein ImpH